MLPLLLLLFVVVVVVVRMHIEMILLFRSIVNFCLFSFVVAFVWGLVVFAEERWGNSTS